MSVEVGKKAIDFTLENQEGQKVSLSDYKGQNIVLYFYPKDMTPGCTTQACDFRDNYDAFKELNTVIIGISPDPIERHQKFIDKHGLPFELLADTEQEVAKLYDVWKLKKMFGKEFYGIERSTFIIDRDGIIQKEYRKVRVKEHIEETLQFIQENLSK
ncbi:thioredoxin-dependent thiol peroxidase [Pseudogracilibacillus sp. SE30717A]|uniref:thioredoxin-dependent thiol peroxidase n=1 Tax=Pseudogracilibacillus sp. SE30717A TaxID=3098293 RepID=UPI00300E3486